MGVVSAQRTNRRSNVGLGQEVARDRIPLIIGPDNPCRGVPSVVECIAEGDDVAVSVPE